MCSCSARHDRMLRPVYYAILKTPGSNIGQIQERDKLKTEKYADLRATLKRLYPGYNAIQINCLIFCPGTMKN